MATGRRGGRGRSRGGRGRGRSRGGRGRSRRGGEGSNRGFRGGSCSSRGQGSHSNSIEDVSASHQVANPSSHPTNPLSQLRTVPTQNDTSSTSSSRIQEIFPILHISQQPEVNSDLEPQTPPSKKGVRGPSRGLQLDAYVAANGKIPLVFDPETRRPSSILFSTWFSHECGSIARRFAPQQLEFWSHLKKEDYNLLIERLESKFIIDKHDKLASECVENIMGNSYRDMRYYHTRHIRKFGDLSVARNFNEACKDVPKHMSQDDWKFLVTLVASPKFKDRSEKNKRNRAKIPYGHRGGSRPFVHHKKKSCLGDIDLFRDTHYNPEKGWINDEAEKRYVAMDELRIQHSYGGSQPLSDPEITQQVLGHRSGYVRGLGWGPRPSKSNVAESSRAAEERAERERAKQQQAEANERLNVLEAQNEQLQRGLTMVLSILRTTGASIPDSMAEVLGLPSQSPPRDDQ